MKWNEFVSQPFVLIPEIFSKWAWSIRVNRSEILWAGVVERLMFKLCKCDCSFSHGRGYNWIEFAFRHLNEISSLRSVKSYIWQFEFSNCSIHMKYECNLAAPVVLNDCFKALQQILWYFHKYIDIFFGLSLTIFISLISSSPLVFFLLLQSILLMFQFIFQKVVLPAVIIVLTQSGSSDVLYCIRGDLKTFAIQ